MIWNAAARVLSIPCVAEYLIKRSQRTPYFDLPGYMERWWLFNPYGNDLAKSDRDRAQDKVRWFPSGRIHHILRPDLARHLHDHPWNARTIILKGSYVERRLINGEIQKFTRTAGHTATLNFGEYHAIDEVSEGGVYTLFITFKYQGSWGFLVDGVKMPWREYEEKYPT